jgi:ATP-binding cassette subfamily B protein
MRAWQDDLPVEVPLDDRPGDLATTPRQLLTNRWNIVRLLPRAGAGLVTALFLLQLVLGVAPVVFVVATAVMLGRVPAAVRDGVASAAWDALVTMFVVAAVVFVAQQMLAPLAISLGKLAALRVDHQVYDELMSASLRGSDVSTLENQDALDDLRVAGLKLEFAVHTPGQACAGLLALMSRYTQVAGFAALVAVRFSVLAAVGLLAAVALLRHGMRGGLSRYAEARRRLARAERKANYLRELAIGAAAGREIRVFGLVGWLREVYRAVYLTWLRPLWRARRRYLLWSFTGFATGGLVLGALVFAQIGLAGPGRLTLTDFALVAQAVLGGLRLGGHYPEADMQTAIGVSAYDQVRRFRRWVDGLPEPAVTRSTETGPAMTRSTEAGPAAPPRRAIRFDRVGFRYPGQDRAVLEDLELTIPAGRCTAIVGANGAGKTTLVKLLARLYEPQRGAVRIDDVDIRAYPVDAWRAQLAVIFQDFLQYEVSAADNIGFGAPAHLGDRAGIRAVAEAMGVAAALDRLPEGMDTVLARHVAGGAELSGGQWQRIALARALFAVRHGAPIVILDEPTASLDMRAEAGFFDRFAALTRGATTVLISHRFSTVRHADLIVVLDGGRVIEQGDHDELIALGGRYAELFRLQAGQLVADPEATDEVPA